MKSTKESNTLIENGITMLFVPQSTTIQNQFFLYDNHYKDLMKALKEMKEVYGK